MMWDWAELDCAWQPEFCPEDVLRSTTKIFFFLNDSTPYQYIFSYWVRPLWKGNATGDIVLSGIHKWGWTRNRCFKQKQVRPVSMLPGHQAPAPGSAPHKHNTASQWPRHYPGASPLPTQNLGPSSRLTEPNVPFSKVPWFFTCSFILRCMGLVENPPWVRSATTILTSRCHWVGMGGDHFLHGEWSMSQLTKMKVFSNLKNKNCPCI